MEDLDKTYQQLLLQKNELFSVRDANYDILSRISKQTPTRHRFLNDTVETTHLLWCEANTLNRDLNQKKKKGYNVTDCCIGFFISDCWLKEKVSSGDNPNSFQNNSWYDMEKCLENVKELFPSANNHQKLAKEICNLSCICKKYFQDDDESFIFTIENLKTLYQLLLFGGEEKQVGEFRKEECCNDLLIPYLHHESIETCLSTLLTFVIDNKGKYRDFQDQFLLFVVFFERFLWIHPFKEGNGRIARILFSLLLKPICPITPLSLFLRYEDRPVDFYIQSIRCNPSDSPVCLAFYMLKCFTENGRRIYKSTQQRFVLSNQIKKPEEDNCELETKDVSAIFTKS